MLHNYKTEEFGKRLRDIRTGLNLTQQGVTDLSGVNIDTLRKIEKGYVVPRYDTLEILSITYKQDLLEVFKNYRFSSSLYEIYSLLDKYIMDSNSDMMPTLRQKVNGLDSDVYNSVITATEVDMLKLVVEAIDLLFRNNSTPSDEEMEQALDYLITAIKTHNHSFELEKVEECKYTYFDVRILNIISVILRKQKRLVLCDRVMVLCLKMTDRSPYASFMEKILVLKIYSNLTYNHFIMDNYALSLKYADEGIAFARENSMMYGMPLLFIRRGIAKMRLGHDDYLDDIKKSLYAIKLQGNENLYGIYVDVLKKKYDIMLEV